MITSGISRVVGHNPMSPVLRQNLGDIGLAKVANCTDQEVHESSLNKKKWQQQARRSKIYVANQKAILDCIKRIEELALELLEYGFDTDEKITGLVAKGIEGGAKYKAAVLYRKEQARLSVLKTEAQFAADMGFAQAKTGGEIGLIADRYGIDIKFLQAGFKTQSAALEPQLKASADAKNQEAIARQQQEAYWKGETTTSGGQKTLSGGLFGSISKSLAGWFKV
ncbi:hypothetical protein [Microcoleus sp. PH2017_18_LLB_O_A]|uniref:hypothetical protein n=1 Tax=Microcoleus sp. PH2017_18_LLB_O_A TaxID=2798829 RepID=UPI001D94FBFA|nr:hypothetical protein [Microcoleus sp. PH2017_18_LLB_O_A]MCC3515989.1 hypothetical protein [Microcoleus sp. PH2017_18_LLB_O_A]